MTCLIRLLRPHRTRRAVNMEPKRAEQKFAVVVNWQAGLKLPSFVSSTFRSFLRVAGSLRLEERFRSGSRATPMVRAEPLVFHLRILRFLWLTGSVC
jgi:hypothetical protein